MDETQTQSAEPTMADVLARLEAIQKGLTNGQQIQTAANQNPGATVQKQEGESADEIRRKSIDPLRQSFEDLARLNKSYQPLTTTKALDDPYAYLGQRKENGEYKVSMHQLDAMVSTLLARKDAHKHSKSWDEHFQHQSAIAGAKMSDALGGNAFDGATAKALDPLASSGNTGDVLIRTDIEQFLYEAYLRSFPAADVIRSFPANGLVHTYDQRTAFGAAKTVNELGDLTGADGRGTYVRKASSNIAILASRRQISLKLQFAVAQSGMNFPVTGSENLEVLGGITSIAELNQALMLQGNFSTASKTLNDEEGLTDVNAYDGLRQMLASLGITKASNETYRTVLNRAIAQIANSGGDVRGLKILLSWGNQISVESEMEDFVRIMADTAGQTGIPRNVMDGGLRTFGNVLSKFLPVPSESQATGLGYYNIAGPTAVEDIYLIDPRGMGFAYLGSPAPVVLQMPRGYNNILSDTYVVFLMNGLVVHIPKWHRKIRTPKTTL